MRLTVNIVGDRGCGKTSLIDAYQPDRFPPITSVSRYACYKLTKIKEIAVELIIYDMTNLEDYDDVQRRSLMFMFSEISVLCYSVDSQESFENISKQWWPEVKASKTTKPYILLGLKNDLRSADENSIKQSGCVTTKEGKDLAKSVGAFSFIECSSIANEGVNEVFETAINKQYQENGGKRETDSKVNSVPSWKYLCCWNCS